ncbi:MAG TPA: hypothetical protein VN238_10755 [Solirubrobacteraceae bacterium]|nr:hypothetical protein [Solirubrobacteraceae bacterium]
MDASTRDRTMDQLQAMGVSQMRLLVYWKDVAPSADSKTRPSVDLADPASYAWGAYDPVFTSAREHGIEVIPTLTLPGPKWAMRDKKDFLSYPSANLFGRFVEAVAKRYGADVDTWAFGNEPNHPDFLRPQYKGGEARSPKIYRALYQAGTAALDRTGNGEDTKLLGELLPRGSRGERVTPLAFLRGVLCLNRDYKKIGSCGRLDVDGISAHPYSTAGQNPWFASPNKDDVTIGTLSRLTSALDKAARAGVIRKSMPVWLTEFGVQSTPDRITGVSLQKQIEYRAMAERMSFANPRVRAFSQYLLTDDPPKENVSPSNRYGNFESGLRFATGNDKPALAAFPLTISAQRTSKNVSLWGLVRPADGVTTVKILATKKGSSKYTTLKSVKTDSRGSFKTTTSYVANRRYKLQWDDPRAEALPQSKQDWGVTAIKRP